MEAMIISKEQLEQIRSLNLPEKKENNQYLILHVYGDEARAPSTFNAKVYSSKKGLKLVTNDMFTLNSLLDGKKISKSFERTIFVDDSGWGFPLGGVLAGAYDTATKSFKFEEVDVKFFQGEMFANKSYLDEYAAKGVKIVQECFPDPDKTLIKICTGFVNLKLKEKLREMGFSVEVAKIGEPLQSELERKHKEYIKEKFGYGAYYDPKELQTKEIVSEFENVVEFIKKNNLMGSAKTGWDYFQHAKQP